MLKDKIKIVSFDPGLLYVGTAKSEYELSTGKLHIVNYNTIEGKRALIKNKHLTSVYSTRLVQLESLKDDVIEILKYNPDYIVTEAAFHQPGRTSAYAALLLAIHVIEVTVKNTVNKPLFKIAPRAIKQLTATTGDANKDIIQEAILNNPNIVIRETKANPITGLTQHSADAIAVAYAFCNEVLPGLSLYSS